MHTSMVSVSIAHVGTRALTKGNAVRLQRILNYAHLGRRLHNDAEQSERLLGEFAEVILAPTTLLPPAVRKGVTG
jgi:hypothetical protein